MEADDADEAATESNEDERKEGGGKGERYGAKMRERKAGRVECAPRIRMAFKRSGASRLSLTCGEEKGPGQSLRPDSQTPRSDVQSLRGVSLLARTPRAVCVLCGLDASVRLRFVPRRRGRVRRRRRGRLRRAGPFQVADSEAAECCSSPASRSALLAVDRRRQQQLVRTVSR